MAELSGGGVIAAMHMAGFPKSAWRVGAAVAYGESSWDSETVNEEGNSPPSRDLGLFQINDHYHPSEVSSGDWRNPLDNAKMAHSIWSDSGPNGGWNSWVVYSQGIYTQHLEKADQAIAEHEMAHRSANESDTGPASSVDTTLLGNSGFSARTASTGDGALARFNNAISVMTDENTWIRLGMFSGGSLILIIGIVWLVRSSAPVNKLSKQVTSIVGEVLPAGKIAKLATGKGKRSGDKTSDSGNGGT